MPTYVVHLSNLFLARRCAAAFLFSSSSSFSQCVCLSLRLPVARARTNALFPFLYAVVLEKKFDKKKMTNEEKTRVRKKKRSHMVPRPNFLQLNRYGHFIELKGNAKRISNNDEPPPIIDETKGKLVKV